MFMDFLINSITVISYYYCILILSVLIAILLNIRNLFKDIHTVSEHILTHIYRVFEYRYMKI